MPAAERIVEVASLAAFVHMRQGQLLLEESKERVASIPLDEIATLVLTHPGVTISRGALEGLFRNGAALVVCSDDQLPIGLALPLFANYEHTKRLRAQVALRPPRTKRLWTAIVKTKILAQAATLRSLSREDARLRVLARQVRVGDPANCEATAAVWYWPRLFGNPTFLRRPERGDQNRLLNYGYAVLRAAVARAICGAGLHPSLGLHHSGRNNPFCLADDLMEPYRPLIDHEVARIVGEHGDDAPLDPTNKRRLVSLLHARLRHDGESRTIMEWIARTAGSMAVATIDLTSQLFFPDGLVDDSPLEET